MHVRSRRIRSELTNGVCVMTSRSLRRISAAGCPVLFGDVSDAYGADFLFVHHRVLSASGTSRFPCQVFPVRARGLRPRGIPGHLVISVHWLVPSASPYSVSIPE